MADAQVTFYLQGRFTGPAVLSTFGSTKQTKNKDHKPDKMQLPEGAFFFSTLIAPLSFILIPNICGYNVVALKGVCLD